MKIFKKFRNKMLILNMIVTSAVVLSAFTLIYFITYRNIKEEIENKLGQVPSETGFSIQSGENEGISGILNQSGIMLIEADGYRLFNIIVDSQGNILEKASGLNFEPDFLEQAVKIAWDHPDNKTDITLENRQWRYVVIPIIDIKFSETGEVSGGTEKINKFSIVYLDVTEYNKTLFDLGITLLLVGVVTLGAIFLVSLYFANRTIKPLAEAWQKQKQFVADASHELKTPLSIINANYDVLLTNQEETIGSQIKWLDYMRIGMDRMSKLINDLLILAKFDVTESGIQSISFDLSHTIQSVIFSMEAAIIEKGISLSVSMEPDIFIKSDPDGLKQVVTILLDNAIKYTEQNGQINISLIYSDQQTVFTIKNSGKGIPKQELPRIFDRFYRSDPSRTHIEGSYGLGLSIAKAVLDGIGAEMQVQSIEGGWTTFSFKLNTN